MASCSSFSSLPLTTTILIFSFLSFTSGFHNGEPCSDDFRKLTEDKNITFCKKLRTLGAEFGWKYQNTRINNTNATQIDILFGAKLKLSSKWIAWGVNPMNKPQMVGTRAIIAIKSENGTWNTDTYNITKETRLGCSLRPMVIDGIKVLHMSAESNSGKPKSYAVISATLILPSNIYNINRLNHVWQVGNEAEGDQPLQHEIALQNVDSTETIDLTSPFGRSSGQSRSSLRSAHGVLNIIGWGTFLPVGVIIARYFRVYPFKSDPTWFYLHIAFQTSGFLIGTAGWAIGLSLGSASKYYTLHTHRTFGILIFAFSLVQMFAFRLKPKATDDYRKYWNMYHHFLGYGLLSIIVINIFKGISILEGGCGWKWAYIGILCLLGAITLALEITTWVRFLILKRTVPIQTSRNPNDKTNHSANKSKESSSAK